MVVTAELCSRCQLRETTMTSHQTANQLGVCNQQHSVSLVATDKKMLHWQKDLTQIVRYIIYWW